MREIKDELNRILADDSVEGPVTGIEVHSGQGGQTNSLLRFGIFGGGLAETIIPRARWDWRTGTSSSAWCADRRRWTDPRLPGRYSHYRPSVSMATIRSVSSGAGPAIPGSTPCLGHSVLPTSSRRATHHSMVQGVVTTSSSRSAFVRVVRSVAGWHPHLRDAGLWVRPAQIADRRRESGRQSAGRRFSLSNVLAVAEAPVTLPALSRLSLIFSTRTAFRQPTCPHIASTPQTALRIRSITAMTSRRPTSPLCRVCRGRGRR